MKCLLAINPAAYGIRPAFIRRLGRAARERGITLAYSQLDSNKAYSIPGINLNDFDRAGSASGDGGLNDFVNYALAQGAQKWLDFFWVPRGTGNGYAAALKLPRGLENQLDMAIEEPPKLTDIIWVGGLERYVLNFFSVGACVRILESKERLQKILGIPGIAGHFLGTLIEAAFPKASFVEHLSVENRCLLEDSLVCEVVVAKGYTPSLFPQLELAPKGELFDGRLRVVVYSKMGSMGFVGTALSALCGIVPLTATTHSGSRARIVCGGQIQYDGNRVENPLTKEYDIRVMPGAIRFVRH